ncbi:MAG: M15 family metallopeptidase [Nocardioides sp.]
MVLGRLLVLTLGLLLAGAGLPAHAQQLEPTALTIDSIRRAADLDTPIGVTLLSGESPVPGAQVLLERRVGGSWREVRVMVTDETGRAELEQTLARDARDNAFRASYAGDVTHEPARSGAYLAPIRRRASVVTVGGPGRVVDEETVELRLRWRTANGLPVEGRVELHRRDDGSRTWDRVRRVRTGRNGEAVLAVRPRVDTRWRVVAAALDWVRRDRSPVHRVDNLPPGVPVELPGGAPAPRLNLPDQARAVGDGANASVTRLPDRVWNQMTGRSWHRGCPVGRSGLRLLRINYWAYDGYRHRGELVAHADAVDNMRGALAEMYERKLPIRSMYRVDRFGWSKRLQGADDYRSMAAGNTSAFNCRHVVGRPGVRSPHSYGRSLDINPWENPYRASGGWVPNSWWVTRSHPRVAWRSHSHAVVDLMARHGLRWTYGTSDAHHFDAPTGSGRVIAPRAAVCDTAVCH